MEIGVTSYKEMPVLLHDRIPFIGNSVIAKWCDDEYQVISYSTKIASSSNRTEWWVNPNTYSKTTSRVQNIIRKVAKTEAEWEAVRKRYS